MKTLIKATQPVPIITNSKRFTTRHIRDKLSKAEEKILKAARENKLMCKRPSTRLAADFSSETMETKRQCNDRVKVLKKRLSTN